MALKNRLHRLRYFCSDAWDEWRHSLGVSLMALMTLVSALFVAGLIMLIVANVEHRVAALRDEVKVEVFLQDGQDDGARHALVRELRGKAGVQRVDYVDKDEALRRYREWASDLAELVNELETNPLPASLEIFVTPGVEAAGAAAAITASLEGDARVEDIRFNQEWRHRLETALSLARIGGGALVALVFVAVVFVMGSVLRLAVLARRDEISIMQLVGATPGFIRGPYLVAGAVQGLVAGGLALALVEAVRSAAMAAATPGSGTVALMDLVAAQPLPLTMTGLLVLLGFLVGVTGSYVSVRQST